VICGLAVMSAGSLRRGGSMRAKTLMCTVNLQKIAGSIASYANSFDGKMPMMTGAPNTPSAGTFQRAHWYLSEWTGSTQKWYALGCLFAAGYINDGRQFYCPAIEGSLDEYMSYSNPPPWGGNLQMQTPCLPYPDGSILLRAIKGYGYWPLKSNNCTQAEYNAILNQPGGAVGFNLRYRVGYPLAAAKYADLGPSKPMMFDFSIHVTKVPDYTINVAYGDAHVELTNVPREPSGTRRYLYPYQQDIGLPSDEKSSDGYPNSNWMQVGMYDYTAALHP
jgi:hypothetical protein